MWLLIVEALMALGMLAFIVWWTMFAGRRKGEPEAEAEAEKKTEERRD
jgi:cyanate permease